MSKGVFDLLENSPTPLDQRFLQWVATGVKGGTDSISGFATGDVIGSINSYKDFVDTVHPSYQWGRHHLLVAEELEKIVRGENKRLIVNMPPRHGKSEEISRLFPAYYLLRHPVQWVGLSSYSFDLAGSFAKDAKAFYQITQRKKLPRHRLAYNWETGYGGGLWSAGVGGAVTGRGFSLGIVDDPIKNSQEAGSETYRERLKEWWRSTWNTRQTPDAAMIVVMTRWEEDDLCGWLLQEEEFGHEENWRMLVLPAIKDDFPITVPESCTLIPDWRQNGEVLWPEQYNAERIKQLMSAAGPYYAESLYQQRPRSETGKGRVCINFGDKNIKAVEDPGEDTPVFVGMDFNITPMSAVIGTIYTDHIEYWDEIELLDSGTEEMCRMIRIRYPGRRVIVYPDPTGSRMTSSSGGMSDHGIIRAYGFEIRTPVAYPNHKDLANEVNVMLGDPELPDGLPMPDSYVWRPPSLFINPKCRKLITSYKKMVWIIGKNQFDKSRGWDHMFDASAFPVHYEFPVDPRSEIASVQMSY